MMDKINRLKNWQAALIITILGFAVYGDGLWNQFLGDDNLQIVNNPPVHSITNIRLFFEGGTFYAGHGLAPLSGGYYRPLMTTTYSLLYTMFGPHPFYFHLLQLLLYVGSSIILYLFFRYSFVPSLALFLSLIFLVHPINSQVVFSIASMPDVLFFFFGILALWLLLRFNSMKSLIIVVICLFLSLLAKETGILFIVMSLIYLFLWNRKRLYAFIGPTILLAALYLLLRINAIGLFVNTKEAPIDNLSLGHRLLTLPSIMLFYLSRLVFPLRLAHAYYWVYPTFSIRHVLVPLVIDLIVVILVIYGGFYVRKKASKSIFYTYLFFAVWLGGGLALISQVLPLDMTVSESWFYFPMVGALGLIGITANVLSPHIHFNKNIIITLAIVCVLLLSIRTVIRGPNWSNLDILAYHDIKISNTDYPSDLAISLDLENQDNFNQSRIYAQRSVNIFSTGVAYGALGFDYFQLRNYPAAEEAYLSAIQQQGFQNDQQFYDNVAVLKMSYGSPKAGTAFIKSALKKFPKNATLWLDLATLEYQNDNPLAAKESITKAYSYSQSNEIAYVYGIIINNKPLIANKP